VKIVKHIVRSTSKRANRHCLARLEDLAIKNWISHERLIDIVRIETNKTRLSQLTSIESRRIEEKIRTEGWKLR
jgi:hypothetical protein